MLLRRCWQAGAVPTWWQCAADAGALAAARASQLLGYHPLHLCSYIVLNRPYALLQWVKAVTIPEK